MSDATNDTTPPVSARLRDLLATMPRSCHAGHYDRGVFDCDGMNPAPDGEYVRFDNLEFDLSAIAEAAAEVEADLLRLAGPPCDYPPCKGARAVEHTEPPRCTAKVGPRGETTCGKTERYPFQHPHFTAHIDGPGHEFQPDHPPAPEIEAWLRERGK